MIRLALLIVGLVVAFGFAFMFVFQAIVRSHGF